MLAGKAFAGATSIEVVSNAHYQADKFSVQVALNAPGGRDLTWWAADERYGETLEARFTLDGDEQSLIVGEFDTIQLHPEIGSITGSGRDLTRRLIDAQIQEAFKNKTSSEIVTLLAGRHGMNPVVTATTTPAERYYAADHDRVQHDQFSHAGTEWDLIVKLAKNEDFDAYVSGYDLHFGPKVDASKAEPFLVKWDQDERRSDVRDLSLDRSLTLGKGVVVTVRSWSSAHGKAFTKSSPPGSGRGKVNDGKSQRYSYTRPNLTEDQAQKEADRIRADLTKHERTISFSCPAEMALTPRDVIQLQGCGGWDQKYFVDTITRKLSFEGGFAMNVTAKNHAVESDAA